MTPNLKVAIDLPPRSVRRRAFPHHTNGSATPSLVLRLCEDNNTTTVLPTTTTTRSRSALSGLPRGRQQIQKTFNNIKITLLCGFVTILVLRGTIGVNLGSSAAGADVVNRNLIEQTNRILAEIRFYFDPSDPETFCCWIGVGVGVWWLRRGQGRWLRWCWGKETQNVQKIWACHLSLRRGSKDLGLPTSFSSPISFAISLSAAVSLQSRISTVAFWWGWGFWRVGGSGGGRRRGVGWVIIAVQICSLHV